MKFVIVGNGIVALSTAFRLSRKLQPSDRIVIVAPDARVGSATLAAAAMLNSFAEIEEHSLKSDADIYHFELSHRATHAWPKFEHELIAAAGDHLPQECSKCEVSTGGCFSKGTYIINNSAADDVDDRNFDAIVNALTDFNEQFDYVDPANIPNYFPAAKTRATRAIYIHNEGWLNPRIVLKKLDAIVSHHKQIELVDAKVVKLVKSGASISAAELENGDRISGDVFLLANGATAGETLRNSALGLNVQPVFYGVGVSLEIKSPGYPHKKCIRTPNRGGACGVYSVPYFLGPDQPDDHILIGASNFLSPEPVYAGRVVSIAHLLEAGMKEINGHFYDAQLIRVNVGWRPTTQDTYPLLGKTTIGNLVIATGTKRDGFHLSPVISELISAIMLGEQVEPAFERFAPERDLIRDFSREDGIEIGATSLISQHAQHGYEPSGIRMNEQLKDFFRKDLEQLHDDVGAKDWGIPPELINMYRRGYAK